MSVDLSKSMDKVALLVNHANYRQWTHQIRAAARFANVWKAIQGTDSAISSEKADTYAFEAREEKALGLID